MVQGYYTLPEAAKFLGLPPEELKQMAQKGQIRSFQDRGTWRFRIQDVQELARQRGATSDPDLVLGEPHTPAKGGSPRSPKKSDPSVFDFPLEGGEEKVDVGQEMLVPGSSGSHKSPPRSDPKKGGPRSPAHAGSDSDVRLVNEAEALTGSDSDVKLIGQDSEIKLPPVGTPRTPRAMSPRPAPSSPPRPSPHSPQPRQPGQQPSSATKRLSRPGQPQAAQPADSGVRLVPMDSDSDVKMVPAGSEEVPLGDQPAPSTTDSDIRLEEMHMPVAPPREDTGMLTDEIDLDAEIRKQEQAQKKAVPTKVKRKSELQFPTTSPFELSDSDIDAPPAGKPLQAKRKPESSDFDLAPGKKKRDSSSDFDLVPSEDAGEIKSDSDDFSLQLPDESALGGEEIGLKGPTSGISLENPVDAGISLEPADSSVEFDLSLQVESTPKPSPKPKDSDSEFELSLDADDSSSDRPAVPDSDSEFELTLDDSGSSPVTDDSPQAKGGAAEKDIFETDFEVPALEDDSGSQVAALDTDLDSSDFDIALDDSATEEESGSQVVTLDEEADEAAATVAARGELGLEEEVDEDEVTAAHGAVREVVRERLIQPAPWGPLPVIFMLPCVIVMVLVGLMGFELVQSTTGYRAPGVLTKAVAELMGQKLK